jgi:predicted acylesterase/phospholipase RssA
MALGCASAPKRNPIPPAYGEIAHIPGIPRARFWGDEPPPLTDEELESMRAWVLATPAAARRSPAYLALSGGGGDGAFGAGLLAGWTEAGDRPRFTIVTGISTGGLIAPFAFLGSDYDPQLKEMYTVHSTGDLLKRRGWLEILGSDSVVSTEPLQRLIARYVDEKMVSAIAAEFTLGRALLIGTTNLDAARPVIWNIGRIAASGDPKALDLIRQVMLASASIPGLFPPVYIEVEANGRRYDEMHVDGGTTSQVFLYPAALDWQKFAKNIGLSTQDQRLYVIRNSRLKSDWVTVEPRLSGIALRSISALIATQGVGDLFRIYLGARRDGFEYNLAYIPASFTARAEEPFDQVYMRQLFDYAYRLAKAGYPWIKAPPGFAPPSAEARARR